MSLTLHAQKMAPSDYVLRRHRDESDPPTFSVRPLTKIERYAVAGELNVNDRGVHVMSKKGVADVLKWGLEGWTGVTDENGKDAPCTPMYHECLEESIIDELVTEIWNRSELSEDEGKNSSLQSKSQETPSATTAETANSTTTATKQASGPEAEDLPGS